MDTVVYRLHNLEKYPLTLKAIERLNGRGMALVENDERYKGVTSFRRAYFDSDRDTFKLMSVNSKLYHPSSAVGINIRYDESQQLVNFELSIPKFFFANNVCEIIPPMQHRNYSRGIGDMNGLCLDYWIRCMKYVFKVIMRALTPATTKDEQVVVHWSDVQLFRWDICFNQIFDSMHDAKHYLDAVARLSAPRIADARKQVYDTGNVTYLTENYYFKVYHKGTDFERTGQSQIRKLFEDFGGRIQHKLKLRKNDAIGDFVTEHEHYLIGNQLRHDSPIVTSLRHVDKLQSFANRVLRYEFEATSKFMSYVYNTKLAKWRMKGFQLLRKYVSYVMREENQLVARRVQVIYRSPDGKPFKTKDKLVLFSTEYWLPGIFFKGATFEEKNTSDELKLVENPQTIKRIEKILRTLSKLRTKFQVRSWKELKDLHKFLEAEKSKEHRFFFATPYLKNDTDSQTAGEQVINAQNAISAYEAASGEAGPLMQIIEKVPTDQPLSRELMQCCIIKHNTLFELLQFDTMPEGKHVELLIKKYNASIEAIPKRLRKKGQQTVNGAMLKVVIMQLKKYTWDDLRRKYGWSRKTKYNWQKKVEKVLNYEKTTNFIQGIDLTRVPRSASDLYFRHYDELMSNQNPLYLFHQTTPQLLLF